MKNDKLKLFKICEILNCNRKVYATNVCERHYSHIRKFGKVLERTIYDPNEIIIKDEIAEIILYNSDCKEIARAIIDTDDIYKVLGYKWHAHKRKGILSPETIINIFGKRKTEYLSNIIMGVNSNYEVLVDHKDHDLMNARKSNLRICSNNQNCYNRKNPKNNTSGYKGITLNKKGNKWRVRIGSNKKRNHVGYFDDIETAIFERDKAILKYHGEFACLS